MDCERSPDIQISHIVKVCELKPSQSITVYLSSEYNRKIPDFLHVNMIIEEDIRIQTDSDSSSIATVISDTDYHDLRTTDLDRIERIWIERLQQNPSLFNGTKFRVHHVTSTDDGDRVIMYLGITDYKEYLGTNWAPNVKNLQQKGIEIHGNSQAFLSDALGVGASVVTEDNFLVLLWRSKHCAEAPSMWDVPGGHAEPKKLVGNKLLKEIDVSSMDRSAVVDEIFDSIVQEVIDEVNIPRRYLEKPLYMGTHRNNTSAGRPSLAFYIRCCISSEDVRVLYKQGNQQEADESTNITFVPLNEVASLDTQNKDLWNHLAPSAKGNLTIFSVVHGFKKP
ncbi:unnamed protein product [Candidula unifasciata]|uniref:Nudix hydrolase domain-containing protein n=1 Tax=Candidula unifasciata TaxID=100452 RepID=A0A8S3Z0V4_9EUPU|nr:unnamed protein product [Candidula unifasciata]